MNKNGSRMDWFSIFAIFKIVYIVFDQVCFKKFNSAQIIKFGSAPGKVFIFNKSQGILKFAKNFFHWIKKNNRQKKRWTKFVLILKIFILPDSEGIYLPLVYQVDIPLSDSEV